jgi:hypothetical protein
MPTAQQKSKRINARRFAATWAGSDTGNASEEEALSKFCALRRMAANANLRIIDVLEIPDVRRAFDDQMQPVRQESPALQEAMKQTAALREELTERMRDVRKMAELLARKQQERSGYASAHSVSGKPRHCFGAQSWLFEVVAVALALVLMCIAEIQ